MKRMSLGELSIVKYDLLSSINCDSLNDNHYSTMPSVVKKRFISVFVASSIAPVIAYTFVDSSLLKVRVWLFVLFLLWK